MTKPRTADQWLALGDDLPVKLAKVFTPGPWKHDIEEIYRGSLPKPLKKCRKCEKCYPIRHSSCPVPNPIKLDWNTAKHWQGKCDEYLFIVAAKEVRKVLFPDACQDREWLHWWLAYMCRPDDAKYVLVIAAMAVEGEPNGN